MNNIFFINNKCVYCNACLKICPTHSIIKNINGFYIILDYSCVECFLCFYVCPVKAIEVYKVKSDFKINKYVLKDKIIIKNFLFDRFFKNK